MYHFIHKIYDLIQRHPAKVGSLAGWFQQGCSTGAAILLVPLLLRLLPKDQVGIWFSFQGFVNIANLADFGFGFVIARQVAYCMGQKETSKAKDDFLEYGSGWLGVRRLMNHSRRIYTRVLLISTIISILIFEVFLPFTKLQNAADSYRTVWYFMASSVLTILSLSRFNALLIGLNYLYIVRFCTGIFFLLQGGLVTLAAYWTRNLSTMAMMSLIAAIINWLLIYIFSKILAKPTWEISKKDIHLPIKLKLFHIAAPMGLVNGAAYLIGNIQAPMIGALLGPTLVAPYYLAQKIAYSFNMISVHFLQPRLPIFTSAIAAEKNIDAKNLMLRTLRVTITITIIANLIFLFSYSEFATLLAGKQTILIWYIVLFICLDCTIIGITSNIAQFVLASGINPFVISSILFALLNVIFIWIFTPMYGLIVIPLGSILAGFFTNTWLNTYCGVQLIKQLSRPFDIKD